jgi:hypothetical protein
MAKGAGGNAMGPGMDYRNAAGQGAMGAMMKQRQAAGQGMAPPQGIVPGLGNAYGRLAGGMAGMMQKPQAPPGGFAPGNLGDIPSGKNMPDMASIQQRIQQLGAMGSRGMAPAGPDVTPAAEMPGFNRNRMNLDTGSINAPMPMNPMRGGAGGMNPVAQQLQMTGQNPAMQNTVMNKLRPTMASNQNVPPLGMTNPRQASAGQNPAMQRVAQLRKSHQWGF